MIRADTKETDRSNRRYIAASMEAPLLERQQEADLARAWLRDRDEAALHEIIESHARLVVRIAVGFRGRAVVDDGSVGAHDGDPVDRHRIGKKHALEVLPTVPLGEMQPLSAMGNLDDGAPHPSECRSCGEIERSTHVAAEPDQRVSIAEHVVADFGAEPQAALGRGENLDCFADVRVDIRRTPEREHLPVEVERHAEHNGEGDDERNHRPRSPRPEKGRLIAHRDHAQCRRKMGARMLLEL